MVSNIFYFHPDPWGDDPIWRAYFSNGLVQPPTRLLLHQSVGVDDTARRSSWTSLRSRVQWHVWSQPFKIECWRRLGSLGMRNICQVSKKMDYLKDLPFGYHPPKSLECLEIFSFWLPTSPATAIARSYGPQCWKPSRFSCSPMNIQPGTPSLDPEALWTCNKVGQAIVPFQHLSCEICTHC